MGVSLQYVCTLINQHFHTYIEIDFNILCKQFFQTAIVLSGLMGSAWLSDLTAPAVLTIISGQFELTAGLVTVGGDGGCVSACA